VCVYVFMLWSTPRVVQTSFTLQQQQPNDAHTHTQAPHTDNVKWLLPPRTHVLQNGSDRNTQGQAPAKKKRVESLT